MREPVKHVWPKKPVFFACGCCGGWHAQELPGSVDCRDDRHRFASDEIDEHYGPLGWEEIEIEDGFEAHE